MKKVALAAVIAAMVGAGVSVWAQALPQTSPATGQAHAAAEPQAPNPNGPKPSAPPADPFPPVSLKNFTADSPSTSVVNDFLKAIWGYDVDRIWSVAAIQKTPAPGVARVVVFAASKDKPGKVSDEVFYITPDGKHAIAGGVMDFGVKPFADRRKTLADQADGPAEGAASKDLQFVEFADLLNAKSKEAQATISNLLSEIPQARLVFENLPGEGSPYSMLAATEGVCVRKAKGDAAFYKYAQSVFSKQQGLTSATFETVLRDAAAAAGADPKSVATCAASQAAKDDVKASIALAASVGIDQAPTLVVNGRVLPPTAVPYGTLKQIIAYQAQSDGITVHVQPTLTELK